MGSLATVEAGQGYVATVGAGQGSTATVGAGMCSHCRATLVALPLLLYGTPAITVVRSLPLLLYGCPTTTASWQSCHYSCTAAQPLLL